MTNHTKKTIWLLTLAGFYAFFVFGFTDNIKGPVLPALLQDLQINYAIAGTILMSIYIGFMIASLGTGLLADAIGQKKVLVLAGVSLAIGVIGLTVFSSALILTVFMIIMGFGLGSLELGCNALIVVLHPTDKGRYLNLMAVLHGLGSMLAPLYAGWMLAAGNTWRAVYRWDLILIGVLIVYFSLSSFPKNQNEESEKINFRHIGKIATSPTMLLYYFAQMIYVSVELGIASWMVEYLQKVHGQNVNQSTMALSIFFGLIMIGRLIGSFVVEKIGYLKSVLSAALAASLCLAFSLLGPSQFSFLLPLSGLFLSIIFPTITASVSSTYKENINTILGLLFTFGGFGGILGPWLVGVASELAGIKIGFSINLVFILLNVLSVFILGRLQQKTKNYDG